MESSSLEPDCLQASGYRLEYSIQRREGISLGDGRHAPRTDRSADEFDLAIARQPVRAQQPIKRNEREPFRSAGGSGNASDVLRAQTVLGDVAHGTGAAAQLEGRWDHGGHGDGPAS